ncbi:Integrase family protein [Nostocoides japonicum T1-X7]|uniref:Integrase family protein n=2 Tax=Intrasporangiaceae TaxID=85021 RepID=A0A077M4A3_9MICO|nr:MULTISPECIES: tyrosine-type recombinase/integrase [Intrasporangiaceae]NNM46957.1 tyrosine-type recombinase/integrase [Knoellia sp. DB2414S]CCH79927.1 Integrase family protein [Tetrasphaera japonica T1-X7]
MADRRERPAGAALTLLADGVGLLHPDARVLEAMLTGWEQQMLARNLAPTTIRTRTRQVRALVAHANESPWCWTMATADEWFADLRSVKHCSLSTIRGLQVTIRGFCDYLIDPAYEWATVCQERFGVTPVQIINEANAAAHVADYEGQPTRRAFTRSELVMLLEHVDARASTRQGLGVKGWASVFRDSVILKVAYGYGTRRNETRMLDLTDFSANPHAPEFGSYGVLNVRYGKAQRGSPPKRRSVLTVWPWTVDVLRQWVVEVRPLFEHATGPALFPSERGDRVGAGTLDHRLRGYCGELGLDPALSFHSLRRSYVTHLFEDNWDPRFVQEQVGHEHASTTSLYTCVSSDFRVRTLRKVLNNTAAAALALGPDTSTGGDH